MSNEFPQEGTPEADAMAARAAAGPAPATEVATSAPKTVTIKTAKHEQAFSPEELRQLSFDQLTSAFGAVDATEAIGTDQFGPILEDKNLLVGKPFVIVHWNEYPGEFGDSFVSLWILTATNDRFIVNDGSTGVRDQLRKLAADAGITSMIACRHGLRVSRYDKELPNGSVLKDCQTFYIDTKL